MTRLSLCALTVALAAGHCLAEPTTIERAMHRFGDVDILQDTDGPHDESDATTTTTTTTTTSTTSTSTSASSSFPETAEQWWEAFVKALHKQLQLQESLMKQLLKDLQEYLLELSKTFSWEENHSAAFARVSEMMEMITTRMATAREHVDELMANTDNLENDALRSATTKFMKEVRVQDVVVDALWASLRGMQTNAWVSGTTGVEDRDAYVVANRAAEEFLTRMYHNLRSAGISEEDIVKFVPRRSETEGEHGRNMGRRGRYGYGYGGYGYGYAYPYYSSYGYGWGYPMSSWSYGYGYPYYASSWGYPRYYGYYGWRRLRPSNCPGCPPAPLTGMPSQMTPSFRAMGEDTMGMGYPTPLMDSAMGSEYPNVYDNMGFPMETMGTMEETGVSPFSYNTPYDMPGSGSYMGGFRNLAPINDVPSFLPDIGTPNAPLGFGPIGGMPF